MRVDIGEEWMHKIIRAKGFRCILNFKLKLAVEQRGCVRTVGEVQSTSKLPRRVLVV